MRDLVAFSTLPAVWVGRDADGVAHSFAGILLSTLSLDLVYVRFRHAGSGDGTEVAVAKGRAVDANHIASVLAPWLIRGASEPLSVVDPLNGKEMRVAVARFGYAGDNGVVVACSCHRDFPTEADRLLLGVATNQTALVLQRRRAERALSEERERLRTTLASIGDAVISTDADGRVTFVNGVAESLTGWSQADAAGRPLMDVFRIVNETSRDPVQNPALRALAEGVIVGLANHTVLISKDGRERPIDDSAAPIRDGTGTLVGAVLVFRDITERKRAEAERERLVETLGLALSAADLGTWVWDPTTDLIVLSDRAAEIFTLPGREYRREWMRGLIHPDHRDRARAAAARAVADRADYDLEYPLDRPGGVWVSARGRGVYDAGGGLTRMLGVVQDVTARKRAEAEREGLLREVEAERRRLADVFQHAPAFMGVLRGPTHVFERVNDRHDALVGGRELVGRTVLEALPEVAAQGFIDLLDQVYRSGEAFVGTDVRVTFEEGAGRPAEERYVDFVYQPLRDPDGSVTGIIVQGIDLTARKRAEREREEALVRLREQDRRKDDFIALLAHELRNPLAPIRNGLQVLRLSDDRSTRERVQAVMDRQLGHMVRLIDDLLDVSRINRSKMELRRGRVRLADVVGSAIETARPAIDEAGHELTVSLPPHPVFLDGDLTRLSQVFSNLLTNSAKYTELGGRIWLSARREGDGVVVTVRDTGIGIPPEALPHIFDMFSQVDRPIERSTGGLGIGLALVKGLVEMHDGSVTAASDGQGRGSSFTVTLPALIDEPAPVSPVVEKADALGPKRRILVVDDNRDGAESLAMMLGLLSNEVRTAHDGVEAVEAAESFRPEVILMDMGMPRLNGYEATRRIRSQQWGQDITVIALTGWGQEGDREQSRVAGCDGHLVKPVTLSDLEGLLKDIEGGRKG